MGWVGGLGWARLGWDRGAGGSEEQKEQKDELLVVGSRRPHSCRKVFAWRSRKLEFAMARAFSLELSTTIW